MTLLWFAGAWVYHGEIFILNIKFYIKYYTYFMSNLNCSYMVNTDNENLKHHVCRKVDYALLSLPASTVAMKACEPRGLDVDRDSI